jgi:hypothetical protein
MNQSHDIKDTPERTRRSYTCVIPGYARNRGLDAPTLLLFGDIYGLCETEDGLGFCFSSNHYLAKFHDVTEWTISRRIAKLVEVGLIELEFVETEQGTRRHIYLAEARRMAKDQNVHSKSLDSNDQGSMSTKCSGGLRVGASPLARRRNPPCAQAQADIHLDKHLDKKPLPPPGGGAYSLRKSRYGLRANGESPRQKAFQEITDWIAGLHESFGDAMQRLKIEIGVSNGKLYVNKLPFSHLSETYVLKNFRDKDKADVLGRLGKMGVRLIPDDAKVPALQ